MGSAHLPGNKRSVTSPSTTGRNWSYLGSTDQAIHPMGLLRSDRPSVLRIALVDDHLAILDGMKVILERIGGYSVALVSTSGREFIDQLSRGIPVDVALVDRQMPGMSGTDVLDWMVQHRPDIAPIMLSFSNAPQWIKESRAHGARGYLLKDMTQHELRQALEEFARTGSCWSHALAHAILGSNDLTRHITDRQLEFIAHACDPSDLTYDQIADRIGVTRHAVDGYFRALRDRFDLHSRSALVRFALEHTLLPRFPGDPKGLP